MSGMFCCVFHAGYFPTTWSGKYYLQEHANISKLTQYANYNEGRWECQQICSYLVINDDGAR